MLYTKNMGKEDLSYRLIYSNPRAVADLLKGYVNLPWIKNLDSSMFELVNCTNISEKFDERRDDLVWKITFQDKCLYIYLILEFQSKTYHWMPLRIMAYVALLYQQIIKNKKLKSGDLLPPVLPIVLYNGRPVWNSPADVSELVMKVPGAFEKFIPKISYFLIDEVNRTAKLPDSFKNIASAMFELEKSKDLKTIRSVVKKLVVWLNDEEQSTLARALAIWIRRVLLRVKHKDSYLPELENLKEVQTMLAETLEDLVGKWKNDGMKKGEKIGEKRGEKKGEKKGEKIGEKKGKIDYISKLLSLKFGTIEKKYMGILQKASINKLDKFVEKILFATTIEEVFKN
ncbi:MAG: Rpn family recombination-promoting nuclease/putative transposase [Candidatus Riflebacteria bacterium]|nr:Rpn family recombination-promoting nuclease/putative transposase [Candidatus Riflebacteria bacterium]